MKTAGDQSGRAGRRPEHRTDHEAQGHAGAGDQRYQGAERLAEARTGPLTGRRAALTALGLSAAAALSAACGARSPRASTAPNQPGASTRATPAPARHPVYIGAYTSGESASKGVSVGTWDSASHQLQLRAVIPLANPSFLAVDAGHRVLYAVDEQDEGAVSAVAIDPDGGAARVINTESSGGAGPTHLCVHPSGRYVLAANYDSGSIGVLPIRADGGLGLATDLAQHVGSGPNADRQDGPHAHQVLADPSATYLHAVDLGTDSVYAYRLDLGTGKLTERHQVRTRPGSGPRHLAFHPSGQFAYLVTELAGTVISYRYTDGVLTPTHEQPTVPAAARSGSPGAVNQPAEVVVSPDGRFVYVSNRGVDLISVFAVAAGGQLDALGSTPCGGHTPRHITLTPTGAYLFSANQDSNTVTTFAVNRDTGHLAPVGIPLSTPKPVCTLVV